jgi:hypothetical protein
MLLDTGFGQHEKLYLKFDVSNTGFHQTGVVDSQTRNGILVDNRNTWKCKWTLSCVPTWRLRNFGSPCENISSELENITKHVTLHWNKLAVVVDKLPSMGRPRVIMT